MGLKPLVVLLAAAPLQAAVTSYTVQDLGPSDGHAINANGLVVGEADYNGGSQGFSYRTNARTFGPSSGTYTSANGVNAGGIAAGSTGNDAFVLDTSQSSPAFTILPTLGGPTTAYGINSAGTAVGSSQYPSTSGYAYSWVRGSTTLTPLTPVANQSATGTGIGQAGSTALGINDVGTIVGQAAVGSTEHGFVYLGGTMRDLGTLGTADDVSAATAISAGGQIVGYSTVDNGSYQDAFSYSGYTVSTAGTFTDLGNFGGDSAALGVNASGQIVGDSYDSTGTERAFVYQPGLGITDLNSDVSPTSGWLLQSAEGVNDGGLITGTGLFHGVSHAFLLTPVAVPEPTALAALAVVRPMLGRKKRRSRGGCP